MVERRNITIAIQCVFIAIPLSKSWETHGLKLIQSGNESHIGYGISPCLSIDGDAHLIGIATLITREIIGGDSEIIGLALGQINYFKRGDVSNI